MNTLGYCAFMEKAGAYLELKIDLPGELIEVRQLGAVLGSLADQYDDYISNTYGKKATSRFYVQEVQQGSTILVFAAQAIGMMDQIIILKQFYDLATTDLRAFISGSIPSNTTARKASQIADLVRPIAQSENGSMAMAFREKDADGAERAMVMVKGDSVDALQSSLHYHLDALKEDRTPSLSPFSRVLLTYYQTNVKTDVVGKKNTGEKAVIESIEQKPYTVVYESDDVENQIKREMLAEDDNIYHKAFLVDVKAESIRGKIALYRIEKVHQVIDLDDDNGQGNLIEG